MKTHHTGIGGHQLTDDDQRASDVAAKLHSMVQKICLGAVEAGAKNPVHTIMILSQAASGILHCLAKTCASKDEAELPINSTATLFAALLSYHTAPCEVEQGRVVAEFSPLVIYDALKDVEKLSGQRPDEHLHETMCRVSRECAADPAIVAEISQSRSVISRDGATLN